MTVRCGPCAAHQDLTGSQTPPPHLDISTPYLAWDKELIVLAMSPRSDSISFLVPQPPTGDKSVSHAAGSGQSCTTCLPLTLGDGDCVDRDALFASSQHGGCSVCLFFVTATTTALGSSAPWKHASTWANRGIFGLTITKTESDDTGSDCVAFLAINGGKIQPKTATPVYLAPPIRLMAWPLLSRERPLSICLASNPGQVALLSNPRKGSLDD